MSERLLGVVVSHSGLARAFTDAVGQITGEKDALVALSNDGCTPEALNELLKNTVGGRPAVVFVDLPAGSCLQAAARLGHGRSNVSVVAGVNLAMLLDFVYHRDGSPREAAERAVDRGACAIRVVGR